MKKAERKSEIIKTVIITFLFLLTMVMVFFHFDELRKRNENSADIDSGNSFNLKSAFSDDIDSKADVLILPSQIAYKKENNDVFAICSGKNYMEEIYSLTEGSISFMLSSKCTATEEDSGAFDDAIASNNYIYIRYHAPLPAILLYLDSIDKNNLSMTEMGERISASIINEIIIFPSISTKGSIFAFTREAGGKVIKYITEEEPNFSINISDLEIYREAGAMVSANFCSAENKGILASTLIFDDIPAKSSLSFSEGAEGLSKNSELQAPFAEILNINPNKTGSYYDDDLCGTVYMATHGTLSFTDSLIEYSTLNNTDGISLSLFSGKESDHTHSMYECLSAAEAIASIFSDTEVSGMGDGHLLLTDFFRKDQTLTFKFGYFHDNIPISSQNDALILEITSEKLTTMKLYPAKITADRSNVLKSLPASWVMSIAENTSVENEKYTLVYRYIADESGNFFSEWKSLKIKG